MGIRLVVMVLLSALGAAACSKRELGEIETRRGALGPCAPVVSRLAVNDDHGCAVMPDHTVRCWGNNSFGQLGNGTQDDATIPVVVTGLDDANDVVVGNNHSCSRGQEVHCWGSDAHGQLGNGGSVVPGSFSSAFVDVVRLSGPSIGTNSASTSLSSGAQGVCSTNLDLYVQCWGSVGWDANIIDQPDPTTPNHPLEHVWALPRTGPPVCAIWQDADGPRVRCWGDNSEGRLGNGSTSNPGPNAVVDAIGVTNPTWLGTSDSRACAVVSGGTLKCWGDVSLGTLGFGHTPVVVTSPAAVTHVSSDEGLTCFLQTDGAVFCTRGTGTSPEAVPLPDTATYIALGGHTGCAALTNGGVECWTWSAGASLSFRPTTVPFCAPDGGADATPDSGADVAADVAVPADDAESDGDAGAGAPDAQDDLLAALLPVGAACDDGLQCELGFCVDGVCCADTCGGGATNDCLACSVAAGGASDGTCGVPSGLVCRPKAGLCDVAETCIVAAAVCPPDVGVLECSATPVPACSGSCAPVSVAGGLGAVGGVTVEFQGGVTAGEISVQPCDPSISPPVGYQITEGMAGPNCWQLTTTGSYPSPDWSGTPPPPPIIVCIHYPQSIASSEADELFFQLAHDSGEGGGFAMITTTLDTDTNTICGATSSLSPFAIVKRIDTTPPLLSGVPGALTAYATSAAGAKVTYGPPTAIDAVDGAVPVTCSRASGATFAPGKTTVTCAATDRSGNTATASFTVWVRYQAPTDGSFFLFPLRADGKSVFRLGTPVPALFKLTGASAAITNLTAKLEVKKISNTVQGTVLAGGTETGEDTDFVFKYRPLLRLYAYLWKTRALTQGTYQLRANLGDGVVHQINVSLKEPR
jgi:hypothetical protein